VDLKSKRIRRQKIARQNDDQRRKFRKKNLESIFFYKNRG